MEAVKRDWRSAPLSPREQALCALAEKMTSQVAAMQEADLAPLRAAGLDDRGILDAVQVIAYFNYINRVVETLGVEPEDFMAGRPKPWEPAP